MVSKLLFSCYLCAEMIQGKPSQQSWYHQRADPLSRMLAAPDGLSMDQQVYLINGAVNANDVPSGGLGVEPCGK